jgi:hypothetical protein
MRCLLLGVCAAIAVSATANGEDASGFQKLNLSKATVGMAKIEIWRLTTLNPDCSEIPGGTLTVLKAPEHGDVELSTEPHYPSYPATNVRSVCNSQKVPSQQAYYQAKAGFTGRDQLVLQSFTPSGNVREIHVDIVVR